MGEMAGMAAMAAVAAIREMAAMGGVSGMGEMAGVGEIGFEGTMGRIRRSGNNRKTLNVLWYLSLKGVIRSTCQPGLMISGCQYNDPPCCSFLYRVVTKPIVAVFVGNSCDAGIDVASLTRPSMRTSTQ